MAILTIGIAGMMKSFSFIQKTVQTSKNRTLASNLAQEKMQILKQKTYYQVLVTSDPAYNETDFSPEIIPYDTGYFPPERIIEGGVPYTRYTYIQAVLEDSGALGDMAPNVPDVGMKRITVTVVWGYGTGKRKVVLRSIMANPDTVMANVVFNGLVRTAGGVPIQGAMVSLVETSGCADTTNASGQYSINATPGTYTIMVSAPGYYDAPLKGAVAAAGSSVPNNFTLTAIAFGRVEGYPWLTDHLVISQVVGSTVAPSSFDQEYVEVFNPTTYTWLMNGAIGLKFQRASDFSKKTILLDYRVTPSQLSSHSYYLFANTGTVVINNTAILADAVWSSGNSPLNFPHFATARNIIPVEQDSNTDSALEEGGGALELYRAADAVAIDRVGWNRSGFPPPFYEFAPITQPYGLSSDDLYARITSTADAGGVNLNFGPAYDSNNNSVDFYLYLTGISVPPHSSYSGTKTVRSGTPAVGAVISCTDGLSASAEAVSSITSPTYAYFSLVNVATGTWTVSIASGTNSLPSIQGAVTIAAAGSVAVFPSPSTFLTEYIGTGFVTGRVVDTSGSPLSPITVTSGGANTTTTDGSGRYRLPVNPGTNDITANSVVAGSPSSYVTASSVTVTVEIGEVHTVVDFVLYQGGRINGLLTRDGVNGLPGIAVAILDANNVARDQQVSGTDGRFTSVVLSTGLYTVVPALGSLEASAPDSSTVAVTMGGNQAASTFVISGSLGYITGSVKALGQPILSGVLIVVTTATFTTPPTLSAGTLNGTPYYMVSSGEDGSYLAEVRGSTYNVYAYYPKPSGAAVAISTAVVSNVSVTAGQTKTGVNFSW